MLGIGRLLPRRPHELSGGERQRVALGKALVQRPAAFLLDEPLSNLDAGRRVRLREELRELHRQVPTTTLLVTHDQGEALSLGERIAVMHQGRVRQVGPPMSVYDQPCDRFVAGFVGTPPMNFWDGELFEEEGELTFRGCGGWWEVPARFRRLPHRGARQVTLGIRPEDVALRAATEPPGDREVAGRVTRVEPLGDSNLIHVEVGGSAGAAAGSTTLLTAKTTRERSWRVNETAGVSFRDRRVHVFDAATGQNLTRSGEPLSLGERG
jgi:multiple sugar transport system ATP-binding protein